MMDGGFGVSSPMRLFIYQLWYSCRSDDGSEDRKRRILDAAVPGGGARLPRRVMRCMLALHRGRMIIDSFRSAILDGARGRGVGVPPKRSVT